MALPTQQKVVIIPAAQNPFEIQDFPVDKPAAGELLVKVHATGLNPFDWKMQKYNVYVESYPAILGTDAAGEVVAVGEGVTKFAIGDRVLFQGWISNKLATFKQYTISVANTTAKIPEYVSYDEAASVPLAFATAVLGLYAPKPIGAGLIAPWGAQGKGKYANQPVIVNGGAGSSGQYIIQVAKLSGFSPIIAIASNTHVNYLKSLGATHIIDRHQPLEKLSTSVKEITSLPIEYAYDTIAEAATQQAIYDVLAKNGSLVILLAENLKEDESSGKSVHHVFGNVHVPGLHKDKQYTYDIYNNLTRLLESGELKPNRVRVIPGGLEGIIAGLKELEKGVSGVKLIANPNA